MLRYMTILMLVLLTSQTVYSQAPSHLEPRAGLSCDITTARITVDTLDALEREFTQIKADIRGVSVGDLPAPMIQQSKIIKNLRAVSTSTPCVEQLKNNLDFYMQQTLEIYLRYARGQIGLNEISHALTPAELALRQYQEGKNIYGL